MEQIESKTIMKEEKLSVCKLKLMKQSHLTEQPSSNWHSARGQDVRENRNNTSKNLKPAS